MQWASSRMQTSKWRMNLVFLSSREKREWYKAISGPERMTDIEGQGFLERFIVKQCIDSGMILPS